MDGRERSEEKNKRVGWLVSVSTQLVLLVLFYFIVAWKEPFPPIPEYGIELGFTSSGGAPSSANLSNPIENNQSEEITEEVVDESVEEPTDVGDIDKSDELVETIESDSPTIEENAETLIESNEVIEDVPVKESPSEEQSLMQEKREEQKIEKEEKLDQRALMPSKSSQEGPNDQQTEGKEENTEIDERALYGSQGTNTSSTEGASLSLSGWIWNFKPKPDDTSNETGTIIYRIVVDGDGYLVKIETQTSTVSPAVERKYRQAVEKLTFSKIGNKQSASLSTGTITFIIKSK